MAKKTASGAHLSKYAAKKAAQATQVAGVSQQPVDVVGQDIAHTSSSTPTTASRSDKDHACFSILIEKRPDIGWAVASVIDLRFNKRDQICEVKFFGGTNREALWENKEQTLLRESEEEGKIKPTKFTMVYEEFLPSRKVDQRDHIKYFFLIEGYEGSFLEREFEDRDMVHILAKWIPIKQFAAMVFRNHRQAFNMATLHLSRTNPEFHTDNPDL
ncbi:MAG: NUDIX domain-containing protein [Candidatus Pacebacteria bacterium]|nr:NUDIX domain-containing protein [Candidatus Paceibacterota bacterium]